MQIHARTSCRLCRLTMPQPNAPAAFMLLLREQFSVEAIEDGATMADIDDATFWAVNLWQPDDGQKVSRVMPPWCVLASP